MSLLLTSRLPVQEGGTDYGSSFVQWAQHETEGTSRGCGNDLMQCHTFTKKESIKSDKGGESSIEVGWGTQTLQPIGTANCSDSGRNLLPDIITRQQMVAHPHVCTSIHLYCRSWDDSVASTDFRHRFKFNGFKWIWCNGRNLWRRSDLRRKRWPWKSRDSSGCSSL